MKYEQYAYEARKFIGEVATELGDPVDLEQADRITTAVFHTLRELLTPEESLHLIAQLPMMVKAIYVNGWHINKKDRIRSMDEFVERLMLQHPRAAARDFGSNEKAMERARAVFKVVRNHIATGEVEDIIAQFPPELAALWLFPKIEKHEHDKA